jgi:hypothetical protein
VNLGIKNENVHHCFLLRDQIMTLFNFPVILRSDKIRTLLHQLHGFGITLHADDLFELISPSAALFMLKTKRFSLEGVVSCISALHIT